MENATLYLVLKFWFALEIRVLYFVAFRLGLHGRRAIVIC